ncbi:hypothetical protein KUTeg_001285 [Tegillarca granosa]|uniref:Uncharacterized protein n=1 Tax=Tegillarca granosa TaxID=220873 RepID=A0ABQ9FY23_TEGGR|nr:hypothetical protein KUTeg_001285 [Tegillarca granosa]
MPSKTKSGRDKLRTRFTHDLSKRFQAELTSALKACAGNKNLFYRTMSHIVDAINLCYLGDHRLCTVNSYICRNVDCNWLKKVTEKKLTKNVTFFKGRAHSVVHSVNNGPGQSLYLLLKAAKCPIVQGSKVQINLSKEQKTDKIRRQSKKTEKFKQMGQAKRKKLYELYEKHAADVTYKKEVDMPQFKIPKTNDASLRTKNKYQKV